MVERQTVPGGGDTPSDPPQLLMTVTQTTPSSGPINMETAITAQCEMYESTLPMDHTLPSENFVQELSYAPSPDSLYMYDQDKHSESFLNTCGAQDSPILPSYLLSGDQLELKNQVENKDTLLANSVGSGLQGVNVSEFCDMSWNDKDIEFVNMEDVFQDRTDANQGPTLTQLNSFVDESGLLKSRSSNPASSATSASEDWTVLEDWAPKVSTHSATSLSTNMPRFSTMSSPSTNWNDITHSLSPSTSDNSYSTRPVHTFGSLPPVKEEPVLRECSHSRVDRFYKAPVRSALAHGSSLHKLLLQSHLPIAKTENPCQSPPVSPSRRTVTASVGKSQSSGEQTAHSMEEKWEEIKQFLHASCDQADTPSVKIKRERLDSGGSSVITSMEDLETRDYYDSDDSDIEMEEGEAHSDQDSSDSEESIVTSPSSAKSKEKQYFWQYNVQSKGPKGKKLCLSLEAADPHVLHNFEDPVFDPEYKVPGITHGGKARKGDGNNVHPNPKKLCQIGNELKKLNKRINEYGPLTEMPSSVRTKSRKEKNKLASRACRLKKKAQHEANKVKLVGLEKEHHQLMTVLSMIKASIVKRLKNLDEDNRESLTATLDNYIKTQLHHMIAGHTTDYVNTVIKLVNAGDPKGGLDF